ncbi:MAG TPA: hypothetical protein VFR99_08140 [Marmoricola sp.]|nr:hypothetical protein [Marmoricola sp.]
MADERHDGDGWLVLPFPDQRSFEAWLDAHHETEPGLWVKLAKKGRGIVSVTFDEVLETAMCFGWVDSRMHRVDDDYYVLRFQPRRPRSNWTEGNQRLAERLAGEGRMRPAGLAAIEAARAAGRWTV